MITIITNDGQQFTAEDAAALVKQLHAASFSPAPSDNEFMFQTAQRAAVQSGYAVRYSTPEDFVEDLLKIGFIKGE